MIYMWKKALVCVMALLESYVFAHTCFQNQLSASTGTTPTYAIGDTIYSAGSTYTYVRNDGTNLFLFHNASIVNKKKQVCTNIDQYKK